MEKQYQVELFRHWRSLVVPLQPSDPTARLSLLQNEFPISPHLAVPLEIEPRSHLADRVKAFESDHSLLEEFSHSSRTANTVISRLFLNFI